MTPESSPEQRQAAAREQLRVSLGLGEGADDTEFERAADALDGTPRSDKRMADELMTAITNEGERAEWAHPKETTGSSSHLKASTDAAHDAIAERLPGYAKGSYDKETVNSQTLAFVEYVASRNGAVAAKLHSMASGEDFSVTHDQYQFETALWRHALQESPNSEPLKNELAIREAVLEHWPSHQHQ